MERPFNPNLVKREKLEFVSDLLLLDANRTPKERKASPRSNPVVTSTPKSPVLESQKWRGLLWDNQEKIPFTLGEPNKENAKGRTERARSASKALITPLNEFLRPGPSSHAQSASSSKKAFFGACSTSRNLGSSTLGNRQLPPLVAKILRENIHPRVADPNTEQNSDSESEDTSENNVIHSYKPLQSQKHIDDVAGVNSRTFDIKDGRAVPHCSQPIKREVLRQPLASIHIEERVPAARALSNLEPPKQSFRMPEHRRLGKTESKPNPVNVNPSINKLQNGGVHQAKSEEGWKSLSVNGKSYSLLSLLGSGGSSKVYQVFEKETSQLRAIKVVDLSAADSSMQASYMNEIRLLQKLDGSDWVIKMYDYEYREASKQLLVLLQKGDTDLASFLKVAKSKPLHPIQVKSYWLEMLTAVAEIHRAGIIHSDLKPANFLFVAGRLKLIDFGIASAVQADATSVFKESPMGTSNYMAPEMFECTPNSYDKSKNVFKVKQKSDVWSLGCILYNIVYGHTPFQHIVSVPAKVNALTNPRYQITFPPADALLLNVLKACLTRDPALRPSIEDLLKHPYVTGLDSSVASIVDKLKAFTPNRLQKAAKAIENLK